MSAELYFLVNLAMDFAVLTAAARGIGTFRFRRIFSASCVAAASAMMPGMRETTLLRGLLAAVIAVLIAGSLVPRLLLSAFLSLAICALLTGALAQRMTLSEGYGIGTGVAGLAGLAVSAVYVRRLSRTALSPPVVLRIVNEGRAVDLRAIIDTGNRLSEPLSGQPVLIVSARPATAILPAEGFRPVAYGSVGGNGTLRCFRPKAIYLLSGARCRRIAGAWIALYPGRLPDGAQALAPAAFALYTSDLHST